MFLPGENLPQGLILTEQFTYKSLHSHPLSFQMGILCTCEDRPGTFQTLPPLKKIEKLFDSHRYKREFYLALDYFWRKAK